MPKAIEAISTKIGHKNRFKYYVFTKNINNNERRNDY